MKLLKHFNLHFTLYYPRKIIFHRDTKHLVQTLPAPKATLEQTLNVRLAIPKQTALSGGRPAGEQRSEFQLTLSRMCSHPSPGHRGTRSCPGRRSRRRLHRHLAMASTASVRLLSQGPGCCRMSPGTSRRRPFPCTLPSVLSQPLVLGAVVRPSQG